jgi:hypothetical protein
MKNGLLLLFFIFFSISLNASNSLKKLDKSDLPPVNYLHEEDDEYCSNSCDLFEMLAFEIVLSRGREDALKAIKSEKNLCFREAFKQGVNSIDNMPQDEKELNCCIFTNFCSNHLKPEHLLYRIIWDSEYGVLCADSFLDFSIYREDCALLVPGFFDKFLNSIFLNQL